MSSHFTNIRGDEEEIPVDQQGEEIQESPIKMVAGRYKRQDKIKINFLLWFVLITIAFVIYQFSSLSGEKSEIIKKDISSILKSSVEHIPIQINQVKNQQKRTQKLNIPMKQDKADDIKEQFNNKTYNNVLKFTLPFINENGTKIEDYIYQDKAKIQERAKYQRQRITFINNHSELYQLKFAKHNLILDDDGEKEAEIDNDAEWNRLQEKYKLSDVKEELRMCIVSPGYNNNMNFRIEYNLNSIFIQNYTNFHLVIIDDASDDGSDALYLRYFRFANIPQNYYTYIKNQKRLTALQNFYLASTKYCEKESIVVTLDADDEFVGRNVLKMFNWGYQTYKAGVLYSNFYWYIQMQKVIKGYTHNKYYTQQQKQNKDFRKDLKFSQLRSYRNELFLLINPADLKDKDGKFYKMTYDGAMFIPLMELSCSRVFKLQEEYHYLYNSNTGINDAILNRHKQWSILQQIKKKKPYECNKQFDYKMKH